MEDNMQQKYEKYMNATKVERIYTRRGDDSIYVDGTIAIDDRIVDYTLEIEDVWFEGIYNITVDEDGYSFRFRQFGNERDVNKRDIYMRSRTASCMRISITPRLYNYHNDSGFFRKLSTIYKPWIEEQRSG